MNALTMTLIAMLLSSASARTLKGDVCSTDYQPPTHQPPIYWERCVNGTLQYIRTDPEASPDCGELVILIPKDDVGNKTLTIETTPKHGTILQDLALNKFGYYSLVITQNLYLYGPDVNIRFYLNGFPVHMGNYQQNFCCLKSGTITTDDPNAVSYEGSYNYQMPGHIVIRL